jgi:sugar phosphate isomerase/epimerase
MGTIYLSLSACGGMFTRQALANITTAGIDRVELAIGVKPDADAATAIAEYQAAGKIFRAHHAFVWGASHRPFNLATKIDRDYLHRTIEWLARFSITAYSVHPGSYTNCPEAAWEVFLNNLEWLRTLCSSHQIELGVETMYPIRNENRRYFLDDISSIDRLKTSLPDLKWVLDLAHLNLWPEHRLEAIALLGDSVLEIHISDNDGRRDLHTAINERTWWLPYLEILPTSVPYVLETRLVSLPSCHEIAIEYQRVVKLLSYVPLGSSSVNSPVLA